MSAPPSQFALLLDLAREPSSEKRRELLRVVTDMFLADPSAQSASNYEAFDEIAGKVMTDFAAEVRAEVAKSLSASALPLRGTARRLAMDEIEVARPVLERWSALTESDLLEVVAKKSQSHMIAVTKRPEIGEKLSAALVERGEDKVVAALLSNNGAKIGRDSYEKITERARNSTELQEPLVKRKGVPPDMLSEIYDVVAVQLRQEILKRYEEVSPEELEVALERSRRRVSKKYTLRPEDFDAARTRLRMHEKAGELGPALLVRLMRDGPRSRTLFLLVFAQLTDSDYETLARLVESHDIDALALLCRAAGFDRALFVTLSLAVAGNVHGMSKLEEFGALYEKVPMVSAQRAMRFWKLRAGVTATN